MATIGVSIDNTGKGAYSNIQLKVDVTYQSGMETDFADLRLYDGASPVSFELSQIVASTSCELWFKWSQGAGEVDELTLQYGVETEDGGDGASVFDFYDDFEPAMGYERLNPASPLTTPTPDETGQCVHPSVVQFASKWPDSNGYYYWMAMTPYAARIQRSKSRAF